MAFAPYDQSSPPWLFTSMPGVAAMNLSYGDYDPPSYCWSGPFGGPYPSPWTNEPAGCPHSEPMNENHNTNTKEENSKKKEPRKPRAPYTYPKYAQSQPCPYPEKTGVKPYPFPINPRTTPYPYPGSGPHESYQQPPEVTSDDGVPLKPFPAMQASGQQTGIFLMGNPGPFVSGPFGRLMRCPMPGFTPQQGWFRAQQNLRGEDIGQKCWSRPGSGWPQYGFVGSMMARPSSDFGMMAGYPSSLGGVMGSPQYGSMGMGAPSLPGVPYKFEPKQEGDGLHFQPEVDILDTSEKYIVHISLPGARKEDVKVSWDPTKNELCLEGASRDTLDEALVEAIRLRERRSGSFRRSISLNSTLGSTQIDVEAISARMDEGILIVDVPKMISDFVEVKKVDIQ